ASLLLLVPALLSLPRHIPSAVVLSSVAMLGVICTALSMLLMFYLVKNAGAARTSIITYINPAVATILGMALLDERLGAWGLIGFPLIIPGIILTYRLCMIQREPPRMMHTTMAVKISAVRFQRCSAERLTCRKYTTCTPICASANTAMMSGVPTDAWLITSPKGTSVSAIASRKPIAEDLRDPWTA